MFIISWILFGLVVGLIARAIMPGKDRFGLLGTTLLGIVGAVVAGWIGQALGWYSQGQGAGFITATLGAILVIALYYKFGGRTSSRLTHSDQKKRAA